MFELPFLFRGDPRQPPLIFLHGFLGVKEDWEELLTFFETDFFCIAYDLPGHGNAPYSDQILKDLETIVHKQFAEKPLCIGYSMGGRIALQLQHLFSALFLLSAHPGQLTKEERDARAKTDAIWYQKLLLLPFSNFLIEWYAQPIFSSLHNSPALYKELLARRMRQNPHFLASVLKQLSPAVLPSVETFSSPTLFLYGNQDWKYQQIYCKLPSTVAVGCVEGCGHLIHLENPSGCAAHIINELTKTCKYLNQKS